MARTRNQIKTPGNNKRLGSGPTALRPSTARLQEARKPPPALPSHPPRKHRVPVLMNKSSKMLATTITQVALDICPQPGVDITGDLEKDVRALRSPSNNFVWAGSMVGGADERNDNEAEIFGITLIHSEDNHNGNVCSATMNAFYPTLYDQRDLMAEEEEVISVDEIITTIRSWKAKVRSCAVFEQATFTVPISEVKGGYPNGMGNSARYPAPWDSNWASRLAERKDKEMRYEAELARAKTAEKKRNKRMAAAARKMRRKLAQLDGACDEDSTTPSVTSGDSEGFRGDNIASPDSLQANASSSEANEGR